MRTPLEYHTLVAHHITVASLTAARTSKTAKQTDRQPMRSCRRNLLSAILLGTHLATCDGFAAAKGGAGFGGGGGGRKRTAKKKEKKKKATATAAKPTVVASPPPEAAAAAGAAAAAAAAAAPEIQEISLGPGRPPVLIRVPPNALSPDLLGGGGLADRSALLDAFGSFRGRGGRDLAGVAPPGAPRGELPLVRWGQGSAGSGVRARPRVPGGPAGPP